MLKDSSDIERFARDAQPGAWATYGRGDTPPRDLMRAMRPYVDAGLLVPTSKREGAGMLYLVKRSRAAFTPRVTERATARTKPVGWRQRGQLDLARVRQCLERAARRGRPCPSYFELARVCQISREAARARVRQLVRTGVIASDFNEHTGWRVITILSGRFAGLSTMAAPATTAGDQ